MEIAYVFLILGLVVAVARIGKFHSLMGQVLDLRRLRAAYEAVRSNRGEPGVDGVTVEAFGEQLEANLAALVVELRAKTYRPQPVRRVLIPKPDGGAAASGDSGGTRSGGPTGGVAGLGADL
ncbi:MAG: hypothetical protein AUI48_12760 [Chloroflexi bacterium 13_1_40CM_2_68_14]|nr:MAG: hypothetical protein AUI48_12760 [Chloroflexi bacterium 13_1_40CM_2_68_14]